MTYLVLQMAAALLIAFLLKELTCRIVNRNVSDDKRRYHARKTITYIYVGILIVAIGGIWFQGMHSLGTLGGSYSKAYAINAAGQIIGESETAGGEVHATLWTVTLARLVQVDIKPGNSQNPINPRSRGKLTLAILTDMDFDSSTVDADSVRFGPAQAAPVAYRLKDIDDDGDYDLVLRFNTEQTGIACGDTEASLTAQTLDAEQITGSDNVRTVGCK